MITGISVEVIRPAKGAPDRFGNETAEACERETVDNVLVSPGPTSDMEAARPDGVVVALSLHFPRGYAKPLANCEVELPEPWAGRYRVVGDPRPYIDADTPTPWHLPVEVEAAHG